MAVMTMDEVTMDDGDDATMTIMIEIFDESSNVM